MYSQFLFVKPVFKSSVTISKIRYYFFIFQLKVKKNGYRRWNLGMWYCGSQGLSALWGILLHKQENKFFYLL